MAKHYYISFDGAAFSEIFPVNDPEAVQTRLEGTQVWRESIDELKLPKTTNSAVYDNLHSLFIDKTKFDVEIEVEIYTGTRATGVLYWKGLFSISDTADNFQNTVAVLNPLRINDDYRIILEQANRQIELDVVRTILEQERVGYSQDLPIATTWVNGSIGNAYDTLIATGGSILTAQYLSGPGAEAYVPISEALALDDIVILDVSEFNAGAAGTFNIMYGAGNSMTDEGAKSIATGTLAFTISSAQANPRIWMQSTPGTIKAEFTVRKIDSDNDKPLAGELLMEFLETFISNSSYMGITSLAGDVVSTFFDNDALPTGAPSTISTFMSANPNGNYVTETATNELNTTIIGLLREWFAVNTSSFKLSFNDIMGQLRDMFQVYWFVDADGKFRVEHDKYFVKQVDDSTGINLSNYPTSEVDARAYNYNKERIASTETFQWSQASNQDFVGVDIFYNNFDTTNNSREYSLNYITTDIKYVIDNLDDASNSGLGIYNCNLLTGVTGADIYEISISTGVLLGNPISNAAFSWANLHSKYWSWSRMSESANVNAVATTFASSVRFLEQPNVRFFYATAIDPFTKIEATLTSGAPIEIRRSLETDFVSVNISYDPYKL